MARDAVARILDYNRGRDADLLSRKFARMRSSAFAFFRGSCHLFYEDWPTESRLDRTPLAWICGDLHLENFGVYKGDNRLVYFDLNDFDEALLAPSGWELARFATSVRLAASEMGLGDGDAEALIGTFLDSYRAALQQGKARWLERAVADGAIGALIEQVSQRKRGEFLDHRSERHRGKRRLIVDGRHALPATRAEREDVGRLMRHIGRERSREQFFEVLDVARRIAGTGSLGLTRYVVLVEGKGSPDQNTLLDLKQAMPAAPARKRGPPQPRWPDEAQRVVAIQRRAQAVSPALLGAVELHGAGWVLRELQPSEDRLELATLNHEALSHTLAQMGSVVAWSHLRSGGRQGSAIADEWIAWSQKRRWAERVLDYSRKYRKQVERDWKDFVRATA